MRRTENKEQRPKRVTAGRGAVEGKAAPPGRTATGKLAKAEAAPAARHDAENPEVHPRTRLGPRERERMIVDGAISFFAEAGFTGQTRELSRRLSITQPLLYRYFPSKKALIDRVYKEVFLGNWNARWESDLANRDVPLRERLVTFYVDYVRVLFTPEWIRLYMYSGLAGIGFNRRYIARFERLILKRIGLELRHEYSGGRRVTGALRPVQMEMLWQLHGGIFYYGVRRFIYGGGTHVDTEQMIEGAADAILAVGKQMFAHHEEQVAPVATPRPKTRAASKRGGK